MTALQGRTAPRAQTPRSSSGRCTSSSGRQFEPGLSAPLNSPPMRPRCHRLIAVVGLPSYFGSAKPERWMRPERAASIPDSIADSIWPVSQHAHGAAAARDGRRACQRNNNPVWVDWL